jgi:tRNA A37 threonylcarbamoyltransferase TsaD
VLKIPWGDNMPGAALEQWSDINQVTKETLLEDIARWILPKPLGTVKKNVLAYSFTGIRTAVERIAETATTVEEQKSLARVAQLLVFEHVAEKTALGMRFGDLNAGSLVVSGGVACNMAFRKMYTLKIVLIPVCATH